MSRVGNRLTFVGWAVSGQIWIHLTNNRTRRSIFNSCSKTRLLQMLWVKMLFILWRINRRPAADGAGCFSIARIYINHSTCWGGALNWGIFEHKIIGNLRKRKNHCGFWFRPNLNFFGYAMRWICTLEHQISFACFPRYGCNINVGPIASIDLKKIDLK